MQFRYFLLHKPYGFLCQFTGEKTDLLLGDLFEFPKDVYSIGRLDKDSEGMLLLSDDKDFKTRLIDPKNNHSKSYCVQVEGEITAEAIQKLENGTLLIQHNGKKHKVEKAICRKMENPDFGDRVPPIRFREKIPTSWIELTLTEGKNRQVRKMTAAVGFPTLRLIRVKIGKLELGELKSGDVLELTKKEADLAFVD
jgi:23S rRNA pseudouridine2457 synthase